MVLTSLSLVHNFDEPVHTDNITHCDDYVKPFGEPVLRQSVVNDNGKIKAWLEFNQRLFTECCLIKGWLTSLVTEGAFGLSMRRTSVSTASWATAGRLMSMAV